MVFRDVSFLAVLTLDDALALLADDDVDEVIVQSGQPVRTLKGFTEKGVPGPAPTPSSIVGMLQSAQLQQLVPRQDTAGEEHIELVDGCRYRFRIARFLDLIELRISLAEEDDEEPDRSESGSEESTVVVTAPTGTPSPSAPKPAAPEPIPLPELELAPEPEPEPAPEPPAAKRAPPPAVAAPPPRQPAPAPTPGPDEPPTPRLADATTARLTPALAQLIASARERGASDVHLTTGQPVRMRLGGRLIPEGPALDAATVEDATNALLSRERQHQLEQRGYVDLGLDDRHAGRLRVNVNRHRAGLKICARLVAPGPSAPTDLGLPWEVEAISNHHQGLVVCSGPSGAGKTTTLAALVQLFNERKAVHIITVEDPVEVHYPRGKAVISQREVGTHTLSFRSALKAALREDPDIVAIGELRDRETVEMALSAAETGHLVIATMSTPSGAQTIERLIDMFPPDDQSQVRASLAGALKLVISQRLLQSTEENRMVAAFEMITGNVPLWSLIRDRKLHQLPSLLQRGRAYGMVRLEDSLRGLLVANTITREAALACAGDPKLLGGDDGGPR